MSAFISDQIIKALEDRGPSVAVAMRMDMASYFDVFRALVEDFGKDRGLGVIYIGASVPYVTLDGASKALEVDVSEVHFIDCVSRMVMSEIVHDPRVSYVEAPTMLENVLLRVDLMRRRMGDRQMLVVLDSINSLALHNDLKMLSEFMQILLSRLASQDAYPVILTMEEQANEGIEELIELVCDDSVTIESPPVESE